jgi:hypothetical protein
VFVFFGGKYKSAGTEENSRSYYIYEIEQKIGERKYHLKSPYIHKVGKLYKTIDVIKLYTSRL